jgi:hypothetical protein
VSWDDVATVQRELAEALNSFDWSGAAAVVTKVIARMRTEADPLSMGAINRMLRQLRRKRQFAPIQQLTDEITAQGRVTREVRRHYVQALIDENRLTQAEKELNLLKENTQAKPSDDAEVEGLFGRIYKQRYLDGVQAGLPDRAVLQQSLKTYWDSYIQNRDDNYWQGINAVALLARAARDGQPFPGYPAVPELATQILSAIEAIEEEDDLNAWQIATAMEAHVALQDAEGAELRALDYAGSFDADVFQVFSTQRQLRQVWGLKDRNDRIGERVLPILDATLLRRQGGSVKVSPDDANVRLEENYGSDRFNTVEWYQEGLDRCRSIARVLNPGGAGKGTGWLVNSRDFFPAQPERMLLITNAHVINQDGFRGALPPEDARVHFQMSSTTLGVRQVWSKPELDATLVELDGTVPNAAPIPLLPRPVRITVPPSRVYIIGHPNDQLMFSLQDSLIVGSTDDLLHYRTPTQGGSSGSPVFEAMGWRVVALHHAAVDSISANEGILIDRVRAATTAGT